MILVPHGIFLIKGRKVNVSNHTFGTFCRTLAQGTNLDAVEKMRLMSTWQT
jgi:hypothetical protein